MAEPAKVRSKVSDVELHELSKQMSLAIKDFVVCIRNTHDNFALIDQSLHLSQFAKSIMALHECSKIGKNLN